MPGTRRAAYLLIFRANALLSAAGNVAIRASTRGRRLPTRTGSTHEGRLYFIYLFFLIACSGLKTRRSTDSSGWQLPHFTFLTEIGRSGRDLPKCTAGCSPCRVCPTASSVPGVLRLPGSFHQLGRGAKALRESRNFLFYRGQPRRARGHFGGKKREGKRLGTERKGRLRVLLNVHSCGNP